MFKRLFLVIVIGALMLMVLPANVVAQEGDEPVRTGLRPDAPPYAVRGPYSVGTMEFVIEDDERSLPVTVWYPAVSDTFEEHYTYMLEMPPLPFMGYAILDAVPDSENGPYPLVLFSHGAQSSRYSSLYLTEHLASYGFVVIAPNHTGDTMANGEDEDVFIRSHATRPVDIVRVIDFADVATNGDGTMAGMIDVEHVAVMGHSSGAWTALLAAGAQRDYRALETWCADNPDDFWSCGNLLGQEEVLTELYGLDAVPEGLWPAVGDTRVDAIVPMAPGNAVAFGPEGLAVIDVPALIMIGTLDMFLPYNSFGPPTHEAIGGEPKAFVTFESGNHMLFGNSCSANPWMVEWGAFAFCSDSVWDINRAHDLIDHFVTAFLLAELYGDEEAAAALAPDAVDFPGITYETTGY
jgi:predicted dienelactone hydrolase